MKKILIILSSVFCFYGFSALEKEDTIISSHYKHLSMEVECETCHAHIKEAESVEERHLPTMDTCSTCHSDEVQNKCTMCHTNPEKAKKIAPLPVSLIFSHKSHIEREGMDCLKCHNAVKKSRLSSERKIPEMNVCLDCHKKDFDELRCNRCHQNLAALGLKPLSLYSHSGNFLKTHKQYARERIEVCVQCHRDSFCSDCHSKVEPLMPSMKLHESLGRSLIHRGDWLTRHRIDAGEDNSSCLKCHRTSECNECHSEKIREGKYEEHPPGWMNKGSSRFHGNAARRNILSCASCHEADKKCVECHRYINPHPSGWKGGIFDKKKQPSCKPCHI